MCLLIIAVNYNSDFPLVIAANRDEFYNRPALPMHFWKNPPDILAGRDMKAGGTWFGVSITGRLAAITNFRTSISPKSNAPSRGHIVKQFLASDINPEQFIKNTLLKNKYNPYNLIIGIKQQLFFYSNYNEKLTLLNNGVHAIGNRFFNDKEPKIIHSRKTMKEILDTISNPRAIEEELFKLLTDTRTFKITPDYSSFIPPEIQRQLSAIFVITEKFGTRCSTVLIMNAREELRVTERTYQPNNPLKYTEVSFNFKLS